MKYIHKNPEPIELRQYKQTPNASYMGLRKKKALYRAVKLSLAQEQGFICCYCGRRISGVSSDTQIEHLYAKGTPVYDEMQLDYETNLLACCDGGKQERSGGAIRKEDLFCESLKGNTILPVNPLCVECENKFLFSDDGEVIGVSKDAEVTIKILNLNSPVIKNMRKYAIDNYALCPITDWQTELNRLANKDSKGQYEEFCFVLKQYIETFHASELRQVATV